MIREVAVHPWLVSLKKEHSKEFSELDVLLRSLDRFFSTENLPGAAENLVSRNFLSELTAFRDTLLRVITIIETLLPEERKNAYWFQKFTESELLNDDSRDAFSKRLYHKDTPEKALYMLYDLFVHVKGIVNDLLKFRHITYTSFGNIGRIVTREIRSNSYFNPFMTDIDPALDVIEQREITAIVKSVSSRPLKKNISLLFLRLFRLLRFLDYLKIQSPDPAKLHTALLILILIRSETAAMMRHLCSMNGFRKNEDIAMLLESLFYQFSIETKRVYLQELRDVFNGKGSRFVRGKIENSEGILKNLVEQSIVQLAQYFKPSIDGRDIFGSFTARLQQSLKLREDMRVLQSFLSLLERAAVPGEMSKVFRSMKKFMAYFETSTFRLVRFDDHDSFLSFFTQIREIEESEVHLHKDVVHNFRIFLETTLRQIENRGELKGLPFDPKKAARTVTLYLE
jgi:hypothetical protein